MYDNGIEELISIMNHTKTKSLTHFIECELKSVGLERIEITNVLN